MTHLDIAQPAALVLVDLQLGILGFAKGPHTAEAILASASSLVRQFRVLGAPIVWVRIGWSADYSDSLKQPVDQASPLPEGGLPSHWFDFPEELDVLNTDIHITKRQWNAFHGTELDLQLRRRHVQTIVLGGVSTNIGVESTARSAWEYGYNVVLAEDAMTSTDSKHHAFSIETIMPRLGRVRRTEDILQSLRELQKI